MSKLTILHLIDDATAGGVMRMLEHLIANPVFSAGAEHQVKQVRKGALNLGQHKADVIISHLTHSWRSLPALISLRARHPGARLIHIEHSYTRAFTAANVQRTGRFYAMLRLSYALFDKIVAVSNAQADWMQARNLASQAQITVLSPRVDLSDFRALPHPAKTPRIIGAIGRLDTQKGFDILIEAFRHLPDAQAQLYIFGQGAEEARLKELAAGDARIHFKGHASSPSEAMRQVDVVAMPSRWEAFGLVCLEARAAARPILTSAVDGLRDQHGPLVTRVSANDPKNWLRALRGALNAPAPTAPRTETADADRAWGAAWLALCRDETAQHASRAA